MTPEKALELLGLSGTPDPDAVRKGYVSKAAEPKRLAAESPSASLRSAYEKHVSQLIEARDLLLGGVERTASKAPLSQTMQRDLPVREASATGVRPSAGAPDGLPIHDTARNYPKARATRSTSYPGEDPSVSLGIETGRVLAERYEVRGLLGAGGMGAVYAAFDRVRGEEVAVKVLLPHLLTDARAHDRFLNEAKIASDLAHPGIVRVYDLHETAGLTFLTMELLRGRSLRDEILGRKESAQRFTVEEVRGIAGQLCDALAHAHGVTVHRDVKPENVWLREDGSVKLMDFGIARLLRPSQFTSTGMALGTAYYMAPEQLRGQEDVDHRADQFAVAVMLYELLTGEVPQGAILAPREVRKSVPAAMSAAVMKALAGDPQKRHLDIKAFRQALFSRTKTSGKVLLSAAAAAAAVVGAVFLVPSLRGGPEANHATAATPPSARAAEAEYPALARRVEAIQKEAEGVGTRVIAGQTSKGESAEQLADLWGRHPQHRAWMKQGKLALDNARKLADKKEFVGAVAALKEAEGEFGKPITWLANASKSLASAAPTRAALRDLVAALPADSARALSDLPESVWKRVEDKLIDDEGEDGPAEADRLAKRLPAYQSLLNGRPELARLAQGSKAAAKVEGLGERYQAALNRLQEADRALASDRLNDAQRAYASVADDLHSVSTDLDTNVKTLLAEADADVQAGRHPSAVGRYQKYLDLRPDDQDVIERQRRANAAGQIAKVRSLEAAGDRDEALTALSALRRESPDSREVLSLVNEFAAKIEAAGRGDLTSKRYDDAKQEFQSLRRLLPGDPKTSKLVESVEARRKYDEEQTRLALKQAEDDERERQKREIEKKLAEQRAAAAAERAQVAAERDRLERQQQAAAEADAERRREAYEARQRTEETPVRADPARNRRQQSFGAAGVPAQGGGIFVYQSNPGTPAASVDGGLERGDVILTINGRAVNTVEQYYEAVWGSPDLMRFTYRNVRNGVVYEKSVYLNR